MPTNVIMPQLGESVDEGTISRWLKHEGDPVREDEPLLEVSTDKVDTEVPAPAGGVLLKVYVQQGQTVERGAILAAIGQPGEQLAGGDSGVEQAAPVPAAQPVAEAVTDAVEGVKLEHGGHVTPVVARMAAEHNLDLSQVPGTGREGRVTKRDVEAYLERHQKAPEQPASVQAPLNGAIPEAPETMQPASAAAPAQPAPPALPGDVLPLTAMRRAIAEHMVRSKHTSPHVTTIFEIDMSAVLAHRSAHKADYERQGVNLTLTAYFVAAAVEALRAVPLLNAQWRDDGILLHKAINIGMAVALDEGLIVPVIKNAQDYNLLGLARIVNELATRARGKQLKPDEVKDGTFTITNHGVSGSIVAMPIINQPQVGILGVGMLEKRVKVNTDANGNDSIAIRPCVYASLTFDHRVADGATADAFMQTVKRGLEEWKMS